MKKYVFTASQTVYAESEDEAQEIFADKHSMFIDWECEEDT